MMTSDLGSGARWGNPYMEWLLTGDIAKYGLGPGANGAFAFNLYEAYRNSTSAAKSPQDGLYN